MQSPPPPSPKANFHGSNGSGTLPPSFSPSPNKSGDDFYLPGFMEEETPLIGSRKGKITGGNVALPRPTTLHYPTSTIPEVPVTTTSTMNSQDDDDDNENDDDMLSVSTTTSSSAVSSVAASTAVSSLAENFKESLLLPFTDEDGTNVGRGLLALTVIGTLLGILLLQASQFYKRTDSASPATTTTAMLSFLDYLSSICGYNYLILWSVCFYPQAIQNYRRQSTHGVSHDFALLNLMGWTYYSIYMSCLYFLPSIQEMYKERFHEQTSTVTLNDVLFATHAMCLAIVYVLQILYYSSNNINNPKRKTSKRRRQQAQKSSTSTTNSSNRSSNSRSIIQTVFKCPVSSMPKLKLKNTSKLLVLGMIVPTIILPTIISSNVVGVSSIHIIITWLDYLCMLSYFKIACTLTKYTKQVYFNYKRTSTKGWNIWYNFLEASGGTLSMVQIVLDAFILRDMSGITGNLAKFLLGFVTIFFDLIFFMQHYVWYNNNVGPAADKEDDDNNNEHADAPSKRIPKHLRANSRFEIAIFPTSPVHGGGRQGHHDEYGTSSNHNNNNTNFWKQLNAVQESESKEKRLILIRAQSNVSLDSSTTTNRSGNEFIGRL